MEKERDYYAGHILIHLTCDVIPQVLGANYGILHSNHVNTRTERTSGDARVHKIVICGLH